MTSLVPTSSAHKMVLLLGQIAVLLLEALEVFIFLGRDWSDPIRSNPIRGHPIRERLIRVGLGRGGGPIEIHGPTRGEHS